MHSVHLPDQSKGGIFASAMGIMFSVNDWNADLTGEEEKVLHNFFEDLKWDDTESEPVVDQLRYGDLMQIVDFSNRWAYKGSLTTPPCTRTVYFNVASTIYPISQKHMDQFKMQLNRGEDGKLDERGNYRVIQEVDYHDVVYIENVPYGTDMGSDVYSAGEWLVGFAALGFFLAATFGIYMYGKK